MSEKTYTDKQLKLAREVMGNWVETVHAGYWVLAVTGDDHDENGNPAKLTIDEDEDGLGETGTTHEITAEDVCRAFEKVVNREFTNLRRDLFKVIRDQWESGEYLGEDEAGGDFESDDVLVQLATLDDVIYG